jgi:hypothetical protein
MNGNKNSYTGIVAGKGDFSNNYNGLNKNEGAFQMASKKTG